MHLKFFSISRSALHSLLITGTLAGIALASTPSQAQNDPPPMAARLAHLDGNVSIQPNGVDDWGQASSDMPVGSGDRVYTDQSGRGELQAATVRAYFSANSDLTLVNLNDQGVELGLAQGTAVISGDGFPQGQSLFISTPNGGVTIGGRASFRLDVYPDQQSTVITNYQGDPLELNGAGSFALTLGPQQSIQLSGTNPVYSQPLEIAPYDEFAHWAGGIETHRFNSPSARYVNPEMVGYDELDGNGDWQPQSDYGPIWYPRVEAGWAPYHNGHWVNRPYYGWTWVADEPWGAAPFHYGRWVVVQGRWGWIPGPREIRPIWSPAQVVFAGGVQVGGVGVSVWFPLGPGEAYRPWYPCSPQYINQINITNIHESRIVHVQNTYVNVTNITNVTYVNRTVGVTAMRQSDFAAGHSAKAVAVKIDPQQIAHIQPSRPEAPPPARPMILHPVAKPAAALQARPVLINHQGQQVAAAPNARPVAVPVKAAPPAPRPIPGRAPIGNPSVGGKPVAPAGHPPAQPAAQPQKAVPPAPVEKTQPAEKPVQPKALPPTQHPAATPPAIKPQPVVPETRQVKPATPATKPVPPTKDGTKPDDKKKKDERKTPPPKPE